MRPSSNGLYLGLATVVVVVAVVAGLLVIPAPGEERLRRLDRRRVDDLRAIAEAMDLYWTRNGQLPPSLERLAGEPGISVSLRDPGTGQPYEFRLIDAPDYELCAVFARTSIQDPDAGRASGEREDTFWSHPEGRNCYGLRASELRPISRPPGGPRL